MSYHAYIVLNRSADVTDLPDKLLFPLVRALSFSPVLLQTTLSLVMSIFSWENASKEKNEL